MSFESLERRRLLAAGSLRIDAGGEGVAEPSGKMWEADRGFTGGSKAGAADNLYDSRRVGDFAYSLPIRNGSYKVKLLFKEPSHTAAAQRTFDVFAERKLVLNGFDVFAGGGTGNVVKSITVKVSDG